MMHLILFSKNSSVKENFLNKYISEFCPLLLRMRYEIVNEFERQSFIVTSAVTSYSLLLTYLVYRIGIRKNAGGTVNMVIAQVGITSMGTGASLFFDTLHSCLVVSSSSAGAKSIGLFPVIRYPRIAEFLHFESIIH